MDRWKELSAPFDVMSEVRIGFMTTTTITNCQRHSPQGSLHKDVHSRCCDEHV